jgi:hypothetical protein
MNMSLLSKLLKVGLSVGLSSSLFFLSMNAQADMARMNCLDKEGKSQVSPRQHYFLFDEVKMAPGGGFKVKVQKVLGRGRFCTPGTFPIQFSPCVLHIEKKSEEFACENGSTISFSQTVFSIRYTLNDEKEFEEARKKFLMQE